jgi:hypothetical protein
MGVENLLHIQRCGHLQLPSGNTQYGAVLVDKLPVQL